MGEYGECNTVMYAISLVLAYPLGMLADRFHPLPMSIAILSVYACVTLLGGLFAHTALTFSIAFVAHGVINGTWATATASMGARLLPGLKFAQYVSAGSMLGSICSIIAGPTIGRILDISGNVYRHTFYMSFGITIVALVLNLILHKKFMALGGPKNYVAP